MVFEKKKQSWKMKALFTEEDVHKEVPCHRLIREEKDWLLAEGAVLSPTALERKLLHIFL